MRPIWICLVIYTTSIPHLHHPAPLASLFLINFQGEDKIFKEFGVSVFNLDLNKRLKANKRVVSMCAGGRGGQGWAKQPLLLLLGPTNCHSMGGLGGPFYPNGPGRRFGLLARLLSPVELLLFFPIS